MVSRTAPGQSSEEECVSGKTLQRDGRPAIGPGETAAGKAERVFCAGRGKFYGRYKRIIRLRIGIYKKVNKNEEKA